MIKKTLYIFIILLLSCCANFKEIEIGEPENISIYELKDNILDLEIKIPISNPSSFSFKIKEINIKTSVNNNYLGRLFSDYDIVIPAKSNEIHNFRLRLKIANIIQGVSIVFGLLRNENVEFQMEGYIKFKSLLINKKINIKEKVFINSFK